MVVGGWLTKFCCRKLRHPNILQFFGACLEPELCLVTAFAERASLFHALNDRSLTWDHAKKIILDVAKGMLYLHTRTQPIVHRDIKSLNILVRLARNLQELGYLFHLILGYCWLERHRCRFWSYYDQRPTISQNLLWLSRLDSSRGTSWSGIWWICWCI